MSSGPMSRLRVILAIIAGLLALGSLYVYGLIDVGFSDDAQNQTAGPMKSFWTPPVTTAEQKAHLKWFLARHQKFGSVEEIRRKFPVVYGHLKLPDRQKLNDENAGEALSATKHLVGIYMEKPDAGEEVNRSIQVVYSKKPVPDAAASLAFADAIVINVRPMPEQPDFQEEVRTHKPWQLVDINGNPGKATEGGYSGGFVNWWADGLSYRVSGQAGPDGPDLDLMLVIARSVK